MAATESRASRAGLVGLLVGTATLYLWGLGESGWANAYYSAAAQAGAQRWTALFFGSLDAANSITVDKAPGSVWVMGLSVRLFGLGPWSVLVPQALAGVGAVAVLYAAVRRWFGAGAGLLAGSVLAVTPVAALMFRFNNPDALLVLLLVGAAYAVLRALENGGTRWLVLAGTLVGFAFLTKMLQALLVLPAFGAAYLLAAPGSVGRRLWQLAAATVAVVGAAGWWVAVVELVPAGSRPYIGGSRNDSVLELTLGNNGLGRLSGDGVSSSGGGAQTGWTRLFDGGVGGHVAWLLPAALIMLVAGLVVTARAPRTDRTRAALVLWGGWLLVTGVVFSFMRGIFHEYYTVALAPAVGALVGIGAAWLWRLRRQPWAAAVLAAAVAVTVSWAAVLLGRSPDWQPWLRPAVLVVGLGAAAGVLLAGRLPRRLATAVAGIAVVSVLAGPAAYAGCTAATPHSGAIPLAGPGTAGPATAGARGGPAGLPAAGTVGAELVAALRDDADAYTWVGATVGADSAAGYQLASGEPVMAVGGFNGGDPSPALEQFQRWVADGRIHYFLGGFAGMRSAGGGDTSQRIAQWVATTFTSTTIDGVTVYALTP